MPCRLTWNIRLCLHLSDNLTRHVCSTRLQPDVSVNVTDKRESLIAACKGPCSDFSELGKKKVVFWENQNFEQHAIQMTRRPILHWECPDIFCSKLHEIKIRLKLFKWSLLPVPWYDREDPLPVAAGTKSCRQPCWAPPGFHQLHFVQRSWRWEVRFVKTFRFQTLLRYCHLRSRCKPPLWFHMQENLLIGV